MIFKDKILEKLREMDTYLNELEKILPSEKKEYLQNLTKRRACEKTIELAIENVIDVISLIVSFNKLGPPQSEDSLIDLISKNNLLSSTLILKVKKMKGFRNILVHRYGDVDDKRVFKYLTEELDDFILFEEEVKKLIKS